MLSGYGNLVNTLKKGKAFASGFGKKLSMADRSGLGAIIGTSAGVGMIPGAMAGAMSKPLAASIKHGGRLIGKSFMAAPVATGVGLGLAMGLGGAALSLGTRTLGNINRSLDSNSGVGPSMASRGYVSWTDGRSEGMSPEHLGASGGLSLALHRTRHRLNLHRAGYA